MIDFKWSEVRSPGSRNYTCGYCGLSLASEKGWFTSPSNTHSMAYIYICHSCNRPTFFDDEGTQTPGVTFGKDVGGIDDVLVADLYKEARDCTSSGSYTASVLCCRKILMHIAVDKGAPEGRRFIEYVEYLSDNHYITPGAKEWVDHIRQKGNEANHEISIMKKEDAEELISFIEMLLKVIYEFPANMKKKTNRTP